MSAIERADKLSSMFFPRSILAGSPHSTEPPQPILAIISKGCDLKLFGLQPFCPKPVHVHQASSEDSIENSAGNRASGSDGIRSRGVAAVLLGVNTTLGIEICRSASIPGIQRSNKLRENGIPPGCIYTF